MNTVRLMFLVAGVSLLAIPATAQVPAIEAAALVEFYTTTNGPGWSNSTGWLGSSGTECSWFGVVCAAGRVDRLVLPANQLSGSLPPELGDLSTGDKTLSGFLDIKHSDMGSWQNCQGLFWDDFESGDTSMW